MSTAKLMVYALTSVSMFVLYTESAGSSSPDNPTVVGVLPQPCSSGNRQALLKLSLILVLLCMKLHPF